MRFLYNIHILYISMAYMQIIHILYRNLAQLRILCVYLYVQFAL